MLEVQKARPKVGKAGPKLNATYINAHKFLEFKLDEILATTQIPGLGAVLVSDEGRMIVAAARGKRKLGVIGAGNHVQADDRWILSSVSKPITGTAIAAMIDKDVEGIGWKTTIDDIMPHVFDSQPTAHDEYKDATVELMMAHSAGFGYDPAGWRAIENERAGNPAYLNDFAVRGARFLFTRVYVLDKPLYMPGRPAEYEGNSQDLYGGGPVICAAMYENKSGERFEHYVEKYLFEPLGMTHSGWGRSAADGQHGLWQHDWNAQSSRLEPNLYTQSEEIDYHPKTPVGGFCMSAHDLGKFLAEFLVDEPKTMSKSTRNYVLTNNPAPGQGFLSSGWSGNSVDSVGFTGVNGFNLATCDVNFAQGWARGACSNACDFVSGAAVNDALSAMDSLRKAWDEIAVNNGKLAQFYPCVHPTPGIVAGSNDLQWLIGRRHNGSLRRKKTGAARSETWPDMIATSGVACASSADGLTIHVAVRGADDNIWASRSRDGGATWSGFVALRAKTCGSGPALACSSDGTWLYAVALDSTGKIIFSASADRGVYWTEWARVGGHIFTAQPGIACSSDGQVIHIVGRAVSRKVMLNTSRARGSDWGDDWKDMSGYELFSAGPSVICDANGDRVQIAGRNRERKIVRLSVDDDGTTVKIWRGVETDRLMTSSPVLARRGQTIILAAYGTDHFPYRAIGDVDGNWGNWQKAGTTRFI